MVCYCAITEWYTLCFYNWANELLTVRTQSAEWYDCMKADGQQYAGVSYRGLAPGFDNRLHQQPNCQVTHSRISGKYPICDHFAFTPMRLQIVARIYKLRSSRTLMKQSDFSSSSWLTNSDTLRVNWAWVYSRWINKFYFKCQCHFAGRVGATRPISVPLESWHTTSYYTYLWWPTCYFQRFGHIWFKLGPADTLHQQIDHNLKLRGFRKEVKFLRRWL